LSLINYNLIIVFYKKKKQNTGIKILEQLFPGKKRFFLPGENLKIADTMKQKCQSPFWSPPERENCLKDTESD